MLTRRAVVVSMLGLAAASCNGAAVETFTSSSPAARSPGALPGHIYLFWGLAGEIFSRGLDGLAAKIRARGVGASVHSMIETNAVAERIAVRYRSEPASAPVMLLGHSSGGDAIIAIARRLQAQNVPVALAFGFDPTPIAGTVPSNIELFINLYQATNLIGGGTAVAGSGFRGRLVNVDLRERREIVHITLDKNETIHDLVVDKVVGVAAAAVRSAEAPRAERRVPSAARKPQRPPPPLPETVLPLSMRYVVPASARIVLWDSAVAVTAQPQDTLESLAAAHAVPDWAVAQINDLNADRPVQAGQRILVPQSRFSAVAAAQSAAASSAR